MLCAGMFSAGVRKSFSILGAYFTIWGEWSFTPPSFSLRLNTGICLNEVFDLPYYSHVILSRNWSNSLSLSLCLASKSSFLRSIYCSNSRYLPGELTRRFALVYFVSNRFSQLITSFSLVNLGGDFIAWLPFYSSLKVKTFILSDLSIIGGTLTFMRPLSSKVR